jgi:hypothetical protein
MRKDELHPDKTPQGHQKPDMREGPDWLRCLLIQVDTSSLAGVPQSRCVYSMNGLQKLQVCRIISVIHSQLSL